MTAAIYACYMTAAGYACRSTGSAASRAKTPSEESSFSLEVSYLKNSTLTLHFLGNGKIRRFGCSLLFSGVAMAMQVGCHNLD